MNVEERKVLTEKFLDVLEGDLSPLGYNRVNRDTYCKLTESGCRFFKIKRVKRFSDWPTFWPCFGFNLKEITNIYDSLKGGKASFETKPLYSVWVNRIIEQSTDYPEQKKMKGMYRCFPIGEWEIRKEKEISKSKQIFECLDRFEPLFYERVFDEEFFASFPQQIIDENDKDFILLQIIAAYKLEKLDRVGVLVQHYFKRKGHKPEWIDKINDHFGYYFE